MVGSRKVFITVHTEHIPGRRVTLVNIGRGRKHTLYLSMCLCMPTRKLEKEEGESESEVGEYPN